MNKFLNALGVDSRAPAAPQDQVEVKRQQSAANAKRQRRAMRNLSTANEKQKIAATKTLDGITAEGLGA